jgi:hypothetical protein
MENSLSYYRNLLLQEIEEKELSPKQKAIAKLDPPEDELDAGDFKAMQAGEKPKMENQEDQDYIKTRVGGIVFKKTGNIDGKKVEYQPYSLNAKKDVGTAFYYHPEDIQQKADDYTAPKGGTISTQFEGDIDAFNDTQNYFGLKVGNKVTFKDSDKGEDSVASVKYNVNPNTVFTITALYPGHPEVPYPNTHAAIKDQFGNEIKKVYTGYLKKDNGVNGISENEDHEVSMANNSLESIVKAAMELKAKMGDQEKDIPAWIQDHITNAANFISQAAENYHEYGDHEEESQDKMPSLYEMLKSKKK